MLPQSFATRLWRGEPSLMKHCQCVWKPRGQLQRHLSQTTAMQFTYFRHFSCLTHIGSVVTQAKIVRVSNFVNLNEIIVMQKRTKWRRLKNWQASVTMNRKTATKFFTSTCDNLIFCDKKKNKTTKRKNSVWCITLLNGHDSLLIFNRVFVAVSTLKDKMAVKGVFNTEREVVEVPRQASLKNLL